MLKTIALIALAAIGILLIYAATRPDTFTVARSATVNAPPQKIHGLINDLHGFNTWNPFNKKDPNTPYVAKIIHVFFNMDRMVGGDFEEGLADLKARAERT